MANGKSQKANGEWEIIDRLLLCRLSAISNLVFPWSIIN
jgi:hypothetical protein